MGGGRQTGIDDDFAELLMTRLSDYVRDKVPARRAPRLRERRSDAARGALRAQVSLPYLDEIDEQRIITAARAPRALPRALPRAPHPAPRALSLPDADTLQPLHRWWLWWWRA